MPRLAIALLLCLAWSLVAGTATGDDLQFTWNACPSEGGVTDVTFPCDDPTQPVTLYCTFELSEPIVGLLAIDFVVTMRDAVKIPEFWAFEEACASGLTIQESSCGNHESVFEGAQMAVIGNYHRNVSQVLLRGSVWIPPNEPVDLEAGRGYLAFALTFRTHTATEAGGSCEGCSTPVTFGLPTVGGMIPPRTSILLSALGPQKTLGSLADERHLLYDGCFSANGGNAVCQPTPVLPMTWGSVKVIYR